VEAGGAGLGLFEAYLEDGRIDRAITANGPADSPHVAVLAGSTNSALHDKSNILAEILTQARERYPLVILDTPSLEDSASTLLFSRVCDGVIMVLEAEATSVNSAEATVEAVERCGGKILGLVFNKRRIHMPKWLFRRL
jgi:MinD-like ATPase involved in chromosome partitioning or flagellar assembly